MPLSDRNHTPYQAIDLMIVLVSIILTFVGHCLAAVYERLDDLPSRQFDFIVIGGGTAGNVVANRLTENPRHSVLVLEAGGSNEGILAAMIPAFGATMSGTALDWNFIAEIGPNNRTGPYSRGFVLGGSSTTNWMAYTRGSSEDWDRYASVTDDSGWDWASMQKYIRRNEQFVPPSDRHNTSGQFNPAVHGFQGVNAVSLSGFTHEMERRVIKTSMTMGGEFSYNVDMNSGDHLGVGWAQSTILNGTRSSSATSYLGPSFIGRPNLHVLLHAHVTRIVQSGQRKLSFHDVQLTQDNGETFHTLTASKEIILSAGTIGTPHILLNSGIGNSQTLASLGIKPVHHLPSVGQNLTEQPASGISWLVNTTDTSESIFQNATLAQELTRQWNETRTGPLVDPIILAFGWLRVPSNDPIFKRSVDPAAGRKTAHYEMIFINGLPGPAFPNQHTIFTGTIVASPASRGSVSLRSTNPLDNPRINLNLLSAEFDTVAMRHALRSVQKFMSSSVWNGFLIRPTFNATSDEELDQYIRNSVGGAVHPVGTAAMSARGSGWGVLDPDLLVKGIRGVRVVDASALPFVPAAHTQAPVYMLAERAADLIKNDW
ncbi:aryl-alcohol oxidase [Moniliophthora roreri MCA 2997]|nr:aryl-alcohol oxidase [Moniliophthora roreri MCA 2997]